MQTQKNRPIQRNSSTEASIKIDKNKLNVVGENHIESNKIRHIEKSFSKKIFGKNKYWLEYQFKDKNGDYADPIKLRIESYSYLVNLDLIDISNTLKNGKNPIDKLSRIKNTLKSIVSTDKSQKKFKTMLKKIEKDIKKLKKLKNEKYLTPNHANEMNQYYHQIITMSEDPDDIHDMQKNASKKRSNSMHESAQSSNEIGIWKIGEDHVKDMDDKHPKKYNLVHKENFNEELMQY